MSTTLILALKRIKIMKPCLRILLVFLGFFQMAGFVAQNHKLKGLGLLTVASPLPIVFTEVKGIETFAHDFYLEFENEAGKKESFLITPHLYKKFRAPYNYRNVVGAAISYGPLLPEPVWRSVLEFVFLNPGTLAKSLGLHPPLKNARIHLKTKTQGRDDSWTLNISEGL